MHRICLLSFVFVLLLMTCASAEIYRCRTVAGELVMTDQKSNFPADCKPVDEPVGHGSFSIEPGVKVDKTKSPSTPPEQASTPGVTDGQDGQDGQEVYLDDDLDRAPLRRKEHREKEEHRHEVHSDSPGSAVTPEHQPEVREPMHKGHRK